MQTASIPQKGKKKKRRLKKKIRIALIGFCTILALPILFQLSNALQPIAQSMDLPVLAVVDTNGVARTLSEAKLAKAKSQEAGSDKSSDSQSSSQSSSSSNKSDGLTRYPLDSSVQAVILLDPGHGNMDPGNVAVNPNTGEDVYEKDINLKLAQMVKADLEATNPNIKVYMTRTSDDFDFESSEADLTRRVDLQNSIQSMDGLDYFISIHCNAMPYDENTSGYAFYIKPDDTASETMADNISKALKKKDWSSLQAIIPTEGNNRLQVVSFSPTHAMLIEAGYMTNLQELQGLCSSKTLRDIADGIAAGISDTIMQNPDASKTPCPEQEFPGVVNPSKPEASQHQDTKVSSK